MQKLFLSLLTVVTLYGELIQSENIVVDKKENLMWQDNIEVTYTEDIPMGVTYCDELILNGYIDWKLPTIKQLQTLIDQDGKESYLDSSFLFFKKGAYWSATPSVDNREKYWYVDFKSGKVSSEDKNSLNHIRCVRGLK